MISSHYSEYLQKVEVQSLIESVITTKKVKEICEKVSDGILKSGKVMNNKKRKIGHCSRKW